MGRIQLHIQVISVFIALLIHMAPSYAKPNDTYQIIVDAGSSGSRLYIYRILPQAPLYAKRQIKLLGNKKIKPGLASLAPAPQQVDQYVKPLLQYAQSRLKTRVKLRDVAINFMATAGMRQLSHTQQQAIYHHLKQYIKHQTPFKVGTVRTITGRWEGIYDWLAVNYLNQTLQQDKTVGVMDMGGASTEITYSPSTKDINQDAALKRKVAPRLAPNSAHSTPPGYQLVFQWVWMFQRWLSVRIRWTDRLSSQR